MSRPESSSDVVRILPPCTLQRLRMATRRATRLYEAIMQPAGIGAAQFGVLMTLSGVDGATITELARVLDLERTTLTRNLRPLMRDGLVALEAGTDHRSRSIRLTDVGRARLMLARTLWRQAQAAVTASLGDADTKALNDLLALTISRLP